jgi:hypothetical protein
MENERLTSARIVPANSGLAAAVVPRGDMLAPGNRERASVGRGRSRLRARRAPRHRAIEQCVLFWQFTSIFLYPFDILEISFSYMEKQGLGVVSGSKAHDRPETTGLPERGFSNLRLFAGSL